MGESAYLIITVALFAVWFYGFKWLHEWVDGDDDDDDDDKGETK